MNAKNVAEMIEENMSMWSDTEVGFTSGGDEFGSFQCIVSGVTFSVEVYPVKKPE